MFILLFLNNPKQDCIGAGFRLVTELMIFVYLIGRMRTQDKNHAWRMENAVVSHVIILKCGDVRRLKQHLKHRFFLQLGTRH